MNILISTNSKYFMPTIVMLQSLFENNNCNINIYMIYSKLSENEVKDISKFINSKPNAKLNLVNLNDELFKDAPTTSRFTQEIYYRLLAQDIIPNTIDRILYLDVDIIINKSIMKFYNQNFDGKYLVVCEGVGMSGKDFQTYERLKIPLDKKYFNSGVILYNLAELRRNFDTKVFFDYIKENANILTMPDQDVLNAIFYDRVKYNDYRIYNYGIVHVKNKEDKKYIKENTAIIHYIGNYKPWIYTYLLSLDDLFWKYAKNTIYKDKYISYMIKNKLYRLWGLPAQWIKKQLIIIKKKIINKIRKNSNNYQVKK